MPSQRWFPADEALRTTASHKLIPPLVAKTREGVHAWRQTGYKGASDTSIALLKWWFETEHLVEQADGSLTPFRYYFAQREAVETLIWLYDVRQARDKLTSPTFSSRKVVTECRKRGATRVDVLALAFEFEMGLFPAVLDEAKQKGIDLTRTMPPDVFDKRAAERGQVRFQDVAYIEVTPRFDDKNPLSLAVELVEFEDRWTGAYIFENEWQSFRTRQNRELELTTAAHTYAAPGRYTIAVKVIDIFGNDTMTLVRLGVG